MYKFLILFAILFSSYSSVAYSASFDCSKASTKTENMICNHPELSVLDELMANAWDEIKDTVEIADQKKWLAVRNQCSDINCLKKEIGIRTGNLLAISSGMGKRIEATPFRYIETKEAAVRCRKNYREGTWKFNEILFSFKENGPTFSEVNIYPDNVDSKSQWDWLIWSASANAGDTLVNPNGQVLLRRNYDVSNEYVEGLKLGMMWGWSIYESKNRGAAFTAFTFNPEKVIECLDYKGQN